MTVKKPEAVPPIVGRPAQYRETDASALRAIAQAAVNVELFTIPLYMGTLYSIQGMHEINAAKQTYYKGRRWPGAATSLAPATPNDQAFNVIFSVFIQEMLHLQLAANLASVMGLTPTFTSSLLQSENHGWICYGPDQHVIPHIIDLQDTTNYADVRVNIAALTSQQLDLFLAIEQPEAAAWASIRPDKLSKYTQQPPFPDWTTKKTEKDLPPFGSIGRMYECMVAYMTIAYDDGTTLWDFVFSSAAVQRELFNTPTAGHPMAEYPGFPTLVPSASAEEALSGAIDMICAITDQGEGSTVGPRIRAMAQVRPKAAAAVNALSSVELIYRSSQKALTVDYPSYDADGKLIGSADAAARFQSDSTDHYARFQSLAPSLDQIVTWDKWHVARGPNPWRADDLLTGGPQQASQKIPSAQDVADALNRLLSNNADGSTYVELSQVAAGSIYGMTRVLDNYWSDATVQFPYPAMNGVGDRMAMCWAVLGKAPNLRGGIDPPAPAPYYHACQGLDLSQPGSETMPVRAIFHTCIGSNQCKGQGGCGFVQNINGGGSCGGGGGGCSAGGGKTISAHLAAQGSCGLTLYSAPANNACQGYGGCAVPISASQLYPKSGLMQVFDITQSGNPKVKQIPFQVGDSVYETAWQAYLAVLAQHAGGKPPPDPPKPSDLRLAFPPST